MKPQFTVRDDGTGLVVSDPITRRQYPLGTDADVDPEPVGTDQFRDPVTSAVSIECSVLRLPTVAATFVRTADGEMVSHCEYDAVQEFPDGEYVLDVNPPVKLYVQAPGPFTVRTTTKTRAFEFDGPTRLLVGARSYHDEPATSVTTTADPVDVMAAVSTFGSALKTTSPERSFPTLRGHPPFVELGEAVHVPDGLASPETGVTLELPPDLDHVLPAASLAYYLGADVVPGSRPWLLTDDGFAYDLAGADGYQSTVERVLEQVFLLDCVVRTEGVYPVDLHERTLAEERLDVDLAALYDAPLAERLARYLDVEYAAVEDLVPTWRLAVDCRPRTEVVEYLPFVANDLGFARPAEPEPAADAPEMAAALEEFTRGGAALTRGGGDGSDDAGAPRKDGEATGDADDPLFVELRSDDTLETMWAGEGRPLQGGKLLREGYHNVFERDPTADEIEIAVVCNDEEMAAEYEDGALYGDLRALPFEVHEHTNLSVESLRAVLTRRLDFFHYIGHVEDDAFVCTDGTLSVEDVDVVGAYAFLLNGCQSYDQGVQMVERGSAAGIVTNKDVGNHGATAVGRHLARLLNLGFSVQSALNVVRQVEIVGTAYVTVGASNYAVVQNEDGFPTIVTVRELPDGYEALRQILPSAIDGLGSMMMPHYGDGREFRLSSGSDHVSGPVSAEEIMEYITLEKWPTFVENELYWPEELDL